MDPRDPSGSSASPIPTTVPYQPEPQQIDQGAGGSRRRGRRTRCRSIPDIDLIRPGQALVDGLFTVLAILGQGGMGVVLHVLNNELGKERALKLILPALADDPQFIRRFLREGRLTAHLDHERIPKVHSAELTDPDLAYIEFEFIRGRTLDVVAREDGHLHWGRCHRLMGQLLDVLDWMHRRGVIHRDLKPSNLILADPRADGVAPTPEETLMLLDFGVAKPLVNIPFVSDVLVTEGEPFLGTRRYSPIEQLLGRACARSDIYAVGVIYVELLSGSPYRRGSDQVDRLPVPEAVREAIRSCLADEVAARPASSADLRGRLDAATGKGMGPAHRPLLGWPWRKGSRATWTA